MAIAFGIISLIMSIVAPILCGWIGFGVTAVFAILAIAFTLIQNKNAGEDQPKKKAGVILGVCGFIVGLMFGAGSAAVGKMIHDKALECDCGMVAEITEDYSLYGMIGCGIKSSKLGYSSGEKKEELDRQFKKLSDYIQKSSTSE